MAQRTSNPPERLRVLIVEDEGLLRDALRISLTQSGRVEVVGDFPDGESALAAAPSLDPQVAVLDIALGAGMNGVHAGRLLRRQVPGIGIVLLSHHRDPAFLAAVPEVEMAGWSYLLKPSVSDVTSLLRAIEGTASGFVVLDPDLVRGARPRPKSPLERLTQRQREVLALIAQGYNNAAIADLLGLAPKTVENLINAIYGELGIDRSNATVQPRVRAVLTFLSATQPAPPSVP